MKSTILLNIVRFIVVFIGAFFIWGGCKDPLTPEEIVNSYAGTWYLLSTTNPSDTVFLYRTHLILYKDSTFSCNASFFLRQDSLKSIPCNGKWSVTITQAVPFLTNHPVPDRIELSSEIISSNWEVWGNAKGGSMMWVNGGINYDWAYEKK